MIKDFIENNMMLLFMVVVGGLMVATFYLEQTGIVYNPLFQNIMLGTIIIMIPVMCFSFLLVNEF